MTRQTKVRIVGDPDMAEAVADCIKEHFNIARNSKFDTTPYRYAQSPGITHYLVIKSKKE